VKASVPASPGTRFLHAGVEAAFAIRTHWWRCVAAYAVVHAKFRWGLMFVPLSKASAMPESTLPGPMSPEIPAWRLWARSPSVIACR